MDLKKINNLTQLFFLQYEAQKDKNKTLLSSLKEPRKDYSWQETFNSINKLSESLRSRCSSFYFSPISDDFSG